MSNLKFIITEPDDNIRSAAATWDTSGAEASDFLKGLSPREITQIVQDQEGLRKLSADLHAVQEHPAREYAALTDGGALVGYARVSGYGGPDPEIEIEIAPPFRRRGCGQELLRRVIQEVFRSTDAEKIVYRVRSNNTASIRLIESLGGILQEPASVAESLLMRRYWVERDGFEKNQHDVERE